MTEKIRLIRVHTSGLILGKPGGYMGPILTPYQEEEINIQSMLLQNNRIVEVHPETGEERKLTIKALAETESFLTAKPVPKVAEKPAAEKPKQVEPVKEVAPKVAEKPAAEKPKQVEKPQRNNNRGTNQQVEDPTTKK